MPSWRRWSARPSEEREDQVRFLGSALAAPFCPCSSVGSSTGFVNRGSSVRFRPRALAVPKVLLPWPRGEAPERHSGQCGSESRRQLHGVVAQRESARFASERSRVQSPAAPFSSGFWARSSAGECSVCTRATRVRIPASPLLVFGSVAQVDESTRLRTVRSQVQVLPEPLFCPCSSVG